MRTIVIICLLVVFLSVHGNVYGDTADFEDVLPNIPATPFSSGGMNFTSNRLENGIFPPGVASSDNGTQVFGWCGSGCDELQLITASLPGETRFNVLSIDAGHLQPAGTPLGYVEGMTVELIGHLSGGGTVTQSLEIVENTMATFELTAFADLTSLEIFAPEVLEDGGDPGTPDPVIDNIVFNVVPEPINAGLMLSLMLAGFAVRRR